MPTIRIRDGKQISLPINRWGQDFKISFESIEENQLEELAPQEDFENKITQYQSIVTHNMSEVKSNKI